MRTAARRGAGGQVLITLVGLIPPFGFVSTILWVVFGRAVSRAWKGGDPGSYESYRAGHQAARDWHNNMNANYQAYQRGREDGRRGW